MSHKMLALVTIAAALPGPALAATPERIGTWVLDCPGPARSTDRPASEPCQLRAANRFLDKSGITADLEVQGQGNILVPVVVLRGVSAELLVAASIAGKGEASLLFPNTPRQDLACSAARTGYVCAPRGRAAEVLAARLPAARSVTARVLVLIPGINPLPAQERSLDLSGTAGALARLRSVGPPMMDNPPVDSPRMTSATPSPAGLMAMADKALKSAGYQNGTAGLRDMLASYLRK